MQYKNAIAPLRFRIKRLGKTPNYSAQIEDPDTRGFDGQEWRSTRCDNKRDANTVARQWADERMETYRSPAPTVATLHGELVALESAMATSWSEDSHAIFGLKSRHLIAHFGKDFNLHTLTRDACEAYLNKRCLEHGVQPACCLSRYSTG